MASAGKWVTVGVIGAPHGVRGASHVIASLAAPADLRKYSPFTLEDGRTLDVESVKPGTGSRVIVSFMGVTTRDAASALTHQQLRIPHERLPELNGDDFYHADLIGLQALRSSGETLGQVIAVHNFGAGDVIEISAGNDTLMVAFSKAFVPEVSLEKNALIVSDEALASE